MINQNRNSTLMLTLRCISVCMTAFAICATAGCSSAPHTEDGNSPSSEVGVAQEDLLYKDAFSPTGALLVVRDRATGALNVAMRGQIGVDDEGLAKRAMNSTLAASYQLLHPEAKEIPPVVRQISDALEAQHAHLLQTMTPDELSSKRTVAPILDKSESDFNNKACQWIGGNLEGWAPAYCSYQYGWHSICTFGTIGSGDKSIAWNESPYNAVHTLSGMAWKPTIPPWTWYWTQWGGSYSKQYACIELSGSGTYGNIGITHHDYFTDNVGNPITP